MDRSGNEIPCLPKKLAMELLQAASKLKVSRIAIVGGVVRDWLLHIDHLEPIRTPGDVDLVVEGSAIQLGEVLQQIFSSERLTKWRVHPSFDTVEITIDGFPLDIASARKEHYPAPGENPIVRSDFLEHDLSRRDFTVNAIALDLSNLELIDPYQGRSALANKELTFLHSNSIADDPTRVIRGARYSARLGLVLTDQSKYQVRSTLKNWPWNWQPGDPPELAPPALGTRLRMELEIMLEREPWEIAISNLQEWGALVLLDDGLQKDTHWLRRLHWAQRLRLPLLPVLLSGAKDALALAARLQLPRQHQQLLKESLELQSFLKSNEFANKCLVHQPSDWCQALEHANWTPQTIIFTACLGVRHWQQLLRWWGRWRHIKSNVSARMLMDKGWQSGPELGTELKRLRLEEINRREKKKII